MDGRVRPFHKSVRDWLTDPGRSGPYWIDVSAQEQRLADLAWREFKDGVNTMGAYCIKHAPSHLAACHRRAQLKELLLDPDWIQAKLKLASVAPLLADYDLALNNLSQKGGASADATAADDPEADALRLVQGAIRLSAHVVGREPGQFASQMVGRLLLYQDMPAIADFSERLAHGAQAPWLRSLLPALHPPGNGLIRTLAGHSDFVHDVAVTPDGEWAVSACREIVR